MTVGGEVDALEARLRTDPVPLVARRADGLLRLDLRSVPPDDDIVLVERLTGALT